MFSLHYKNIRHIHKFNYCVLLGYSRLLIAHMKAFLVANAIFTYCLTVCISEDATRIQGRVQYDSRSNEIVGFVLPINSENSLPIPSMIKVRNTDEIVGHFTRKIPTASFVNTIMVQPIGKVPPFCLLIFGTDCKFTSANVADR